MLQLTDIHGDVTVELPLDTSQTPTALAYDEYGNPQGDIRATRYGWLGGKQRSSESPRDATNGGRASRPAHTSGVQKGRGTGRLEERPCRQDPFVSGTANTKSHTRHRRGRFRDESHLTDSDDSTRLVRLKHSRAVSTRQDKRAYVFHGTIVVASIRL
ncbi:hypothetical protein [Streptomyces nodosus]|uniref:Uncharacterized protein n=1 Tax=Streptomyces nodosus TaxID=40318 RepID=A0A0B5DC68_9ACTN|nr:hypothetical protein [Streptomyces nodosus]AJE38805.1 hypothetical protein SNOD_00980 [Streptomyces nodosus]MBB4789570.1 hypothetical protein [Streptomyces nodosus]